MGGIERSTVAHQTKLFRFGLSFTADFSVAMLEQELAANALLYDNKSAGAIPNVADLQHYSKQRFGMALK